MVNAPAHAEVERVDVGADAITIRGELVGLEEPPAPAELIARRRSDRHEVRLPGTLHDGRFEVEVAFRALPWVDDAEPEFWTLWLGGLQLGRRLDGVRDKRHAYVFAPRCAHLPNGVRRFRPSYGTRNQLVIRSGPVGDQAHLALPPMRRRRPTVIPVGELALHRFVRALAGVLLRRRPRGATPKVTIVIDDAYAMGGTARTCLNVARYLSRHHDVEIISVAREREKPFFRFPPGVRVRVADDRRELPLRGSAGRIRSRLRWRRSRLLFPGDLRFAGESTLWTDLRLLRLLWDAGDGVVMTTRAGLNLLAPALRRRGMTVIGQEHMNLEAHLPQRQAEMARRYCALDALTVLTERDRDTYARALGDSVRLEHIPNAVPGLDAAVPSLDRPVIVAAGRLTLQKGFDLLIPAFAQVVEHHPEWTLRICGSGPQRRRLGELVLEHDLSNNVLLMGPIDRLDRQMSQASMYVLSSRFEGLPMVMIEAMSLGLPVVSFDCPTGPGDVIEDGVSGVLVPDGDIDALARAMIDVVEDRERRKALGAGAAVRARDFALDAIGPRWEALIEDLAAEPAGHGRDGLPDRVAGLRARVGDDRNARQRKAAAGRRRP